MSKDKPTLVVDARPKRLISGIVDSYFDSAKPELEEKGYHVASLAEFAELIMQEGTDSDVYRKPCIVEEGLVHTPSGNCARLVRHSPLWVARKEETGTNPHFGGPRYKFISTDEQVEKSLEDSVDYPLQKNEVGPVEIPTNRFGYDALPIWAFGQGDEKKAQNFGDFLRKRGVMMFPFARLTKGNLPCYQVQFTLDDSKRPFILQYDGSRDGGPVRGVKVWSCHERE